MSVAWRRMLVATPWPVLAGRTVVACLYTILACFSVAFAVHIHYQYLWGDFKHWDDVLPGLNKPFFPAFGMYVHWLGGSTILLIGLVQLFSVTRRVDMRVHRVLGTVYILSAFCASIGGNVFIYTHGCVGGANMDIAFSVAGWTMFVLAAGTYYHARAGHRTRHRNWAIRLWGQGIASLGYRLWYHLLAGIFRYKVTRMSDFHRPLDEALDWWFFVPNLVVTEVVVWHLTRRDAARAAAVAGADVKQPGSLLEDERLEEDVEAHMLLDAPSPGDGVGEAV